MATESSSEPVRKSRSPIDLHELRITLGILRQSYITTFSIAIVVAFFAVALFVYVTGGHVLPYPPNLINTREILQPPSLAHPLGTDSLGRDILSRVLDGTPIDAKVPIAVLAIALSFGMITGTIAGFVGGVVEEAIMRVTDIFLAFPGIVLALAIVAALGPSVNNSIIALAPVWWPVYTRLARGQTLSIKSQPFVEASRAIGQRPRATLLRHIVPNILPVMLVYAALDFGNVILTFSVLSFLGVGAQPPLSEWGLMTVQQEQYLSTAAWAPVVPALAIFLVAISFSLFGDGLRDAFDPKIRGLSN
ncbi:MAG: ABC transporter permease [Nitrososphaerales archaeon]|jgi:peptide/nickel transport system permease protein